MTRYSIILERNDLGHMSPNTLGTDSFNAINSIPGTTDVQIESESGSQVKISFAWTEAEEFLSTQEHLSRFNLCRVTR